MTHQEWKSIRRRCKFLPRRFSQRFIASELKERNEYRRMIRAVQNGLQYPTTLRYNVYKALRAGTVVHAYCKMGKTIQRGSVMSHDPKTAMYLIEFENEAYGYEYCPDTDVASCEIQNLDIENREGKVQGTSLALFASISPTLGSNNLTIALRLVSVAAIKAVEAAIVSPDTSSTSKKLVEAIANQDAFLALLEIIDMSRIRKYEILSLISDANTLAVDILPFGDDEESEQTVPILSKNVRDHIQWLHSNLNQTNQVLCAATDIFQALYDGSLRHTIAGKGRQGDSSTTKTHKPASRGNSLP
jgi:DIRP